MPAKKPASISQMFAPASQNQEVLQLQDRVEELEDELRQLRSQELDSNVRTALEEQIQELAHQLAQQGGEHYISLDQIQPDSDQPRTVFPPTVIQARAKSLLEEGQHSPIILIPQTDSGYKLFDGELRWRSAPQAGLTTLRAVFLTQEALDKLDKAAVFDRQLTTSLQSEKLHPFDLANGLVKLMVMRHPQLNEQVKSIPSLLNAIIQRLRRSGEIAELEAVAIADQNVQQEWIEKVCTSETERWILEVILSKQLNPVSINSNVFTLLNLPEDLQSVVRTEGLEGSKVLELKKISGKNLNIEEEEAIDLRTKLIHEVIHQGLSLDKIRSKVKATLQMHKDPQQQPKTLDLSQRLSSIPKQLKQAKVWEDAKKRQKLEKLLNELEGLLL
ncbi:MAG: ParB N-terminal domain-containing protein [Leptolyngbyaceae cyanobacterium bins.302]|nr:ParB N-terminal domain-containing protein [Leptolyngbyaceae cyanobacterium bins.302]